MQEFIRAFDSGGGIRDIPIVQGSVPFLSVPFPGWPAGTGILLASLVANSSASRTNNIVTITATAHGITTGSTYVGFRFYYPGSPSLAAGLYDSILSIPDANTLTFSAPGADFVGEPINSNNPWTSGTDLTSIVIPGGLLKDRSSVTAKIYRFGDITASNKALSIFYGGSGLTYQNLGSSSIGELRYSFRCMGLNKQISQASTYDGSVSTISPAVLTKDTTVDQVFTIRGYVTAAGGFVGLYAASLEIKI